MHLVEFWEQDALSELEFLILALVAKVVHGNLALVDLELDLVVLNAGLLVYDLLPTLLFLAFLVIFVVKLDISLKIF